LERAGVYLDQALQLSQTLGYSELQAKTLILHDILNSTVSGNMSRLPSSKISNAIDDTYHLSVEEHWGLAMLAHLRSDFETALHHAQACVKLGQSFANPFLTLGGYFVLGMSHASSGRYQAALDELIKALNLSEAAGDRFWRARLLNTIGWVYHDLFNLEQAVQFNQLSLEIARAGKPLLTEAEGNAIANLAADYLLLKDYDRARAYLVEGLSNSPETFLRWRYRTRMVVIKGQLALAEGDALGALEAADESLNLARHTQTRKNIARSCHLRGQALLATGQLDKAQLALNHSLEVSLGLNCPTLIWPCHVSLAQLKEAEDRMKLAQTHYASAYRILHQILEGLTDPLLYQSFFAATSVQLVYTKAALPT
jgi:tetratricopeptide (TPR) repeat protein